MIIIGFMGQLVFCIRKFTTPKYFPIKHLELNASYEHVKQNDIKKITNLYTDDGFFRLNVWKLKQQLSKSPWIYTASVRRGWPDTINIDIVEQRPVLRWGKDSLVNQDGGIFTPPITTFPKGLPIIFGPNDKKTEIFVIYHQIILALEPLNLTIKKLTLKPQHYWELLLSNDIIVYMKERSPLEQIKLLTNIYNKLDIKHAQKPQVIDLRYQSGLAIKWE
jgi:cell division protein FtsQ